MGSLQVGDGRFNQGVQVGPASEGRKRRLLQHLAPYQPQRHLTGPIHGDQGRTAQGGTGVGIAGHGGDLAGPGEEGAEAAWLHLIAQGLVAPAQGGQLQVEDLAGGRAPGMAGEKKLRLLAFGGFPVLESLAPLRAGGGPGARAQGEAAAFAAAAGGTGVHQGGRPALQQLPQGRTGVGAQDRVAQPVRHHQKQSLFEGGLIRNGEGARFLAQDRGSKSGGGKTDQNQREDNPR